MDGGGHVQTVVGMLREVIDSEHEVFVFKLIIFLLSTLDRGSRENVVRFVHAGGAAVLASLMVLSAEKVTHTTYRIDFLAGLIIPEISFALLRRNEMISM